MKFPLRLRIHLFFAALACATVLGQAQTPVTEQPAAGAPEKYAPNPAADTQDLEWTPPALAALGLQATARSSFTLDRSMLAAASNLLPQTDEPTRQAIAKLDAVSVHLLRFNSSSPADPAQVEVLRSAYHRRGWKHLISSGDKEGKLRGESTDLWLTFNGANVQGAVLLVNRPTTLALITLKGDLSPVDLLHLRGHFGIPRFEADGFRDERER